MITPAWGLALIGATVVYFVPLGYIQNKELIDHHLENASNVIGQQTQQMKAIVAQHTKQAMEVGSKTFKDYSARASDIVGQGKQKAVDNNVVTPQTADKAGEFVRGENFPQAPREDPSSPANLQAQQARAEPVPEFAQ